MIGRPYADPRLPLPKTAVKLILIVIIYKLNR